MRTADGRTIEHDYWPVLVEGQFRGDLWLAWDMSAHVALDEQRQQALEAELAARRLADEARQQLEGQNQRLRKLDEARASSWPSCRTSCARRSPRSSPSAS